MDWGRVRGVVVLVSVISSILNVPDNRATDIDALFMSRSYEEKYMLPDNQSMASPSGLLKPEKSIKRIYISMVCSSKRCPPLDSMAVYSHSYIHWSKIMFKGK